MLLLHFTCTGEYLGFLYYVTHCCLFLQHGHDFVPQRYSAAPELPSPFPHTVKRKLARAPPLKLLPLRTRLGRRQHPQVGHSTQRRRLRLRLRQGATSDWSSCGRSTTLRMATTISTRARHRGSGLPCTSRRVLHTAQAQRLHQTRRLSPARHLRPKRRAAGGRVATASSVAPFTGHGGAKRMATMPTLKRKTLLWTTAGAEA